MGIDGDQIGYFICYPVNTEKNEQSTMNVDHFRTETTTDFHSFCSSTTEPSYWTRPEMLELGLGGASVSVPVFFKTFD